MLSDDALEVALKAISREIAERRQTDTSMSPDDTERLEVARDEICDELQP